MTKKKRIVLLTMLIFVIGSLCTFVYIYAGNWIPSQKLITQLYTLEEVHTALDEYWNGYEFFDLGTFDELSGIFNFECIRKTVQGSYAVLHLTDGSKLFIFFYQGEAYYAKILSDFPHTSELPEFIVNETRGGEVDLYDNSTVEFGWLSGTRIMGVYSQEGVWYIMMQPREEPDGIEDLGWLNSWMVVEAEYIPNDQLKLSVIFSSKLYHIRYILPIDRK